MNYLIFRIFLVAVDVIFLVQLTSGQEFSDVMRLPNCEDFDPNCPSLTRRTGVDVEGIPCLDLEIQRKCPRSCNVCLPETPFTGCEDTLPQFCAEKIKTRNDCHQDPRVMLVLCGKSCGTCPPSKPEDCRQDLHASCFIGALWGMCKTAPLFYQNCCPFSCRDHLAFCKAGKAENFPSTTNEVCNNRNFDCGTQRDSGAAAIGAGRKKRQAMNQWMKFSQSGHSINRQGHSTFIRQNNKHPTSNRGSNRSNRRRNHFSNQNQFNRNQNQHNIQNHFNRNQNQHNSQIRFNRNQNQHKRQDHFNRNQNQHNTQIRFNRNQNRHNNQNQFNRNQNQHNKQNQFNRNQNQFNRPSNLNVQRNQNGQQSQQPQMNQQTRTSSMGNLDHDRDRTLVPFCEYEKFMELYLLLEKVTTINSGLPIIDELEDLILDINFCQYGINSPLERNSFIRDIYQPQLDLDAPTGFTGLQFANQIDPSSSNRAVRSISFPSSSTDLDETESSQNSRQKRQASINDIDGIGKVRVDESTISTRSSRGLFSCGGSLITPYHVVTAAHCVFTKRRPKTIRLGERDFSRTDESEAYDYTIDSINHHQDYTGLSKLADVAIVLLKHKVDFTPDILPFCLPKEKRSLEGRTSFISGWGARGHNEARLTTLLSNFKLTIFNNEECARNYSVTGRSREMDLFTKSYPGGVLPESVFCAGGEEDLVCQGDSGGPANIIDEDGKFVTVGVVNKGYGCFNRQFPGVYIRISSFNDWIEDTLYGDCNAFQPSSSFPSDQVKSEPTIKPIPVSPPITSRPERPGLQEGCQCPNPHQPPPSFPSSGYLPPYQTANNRPVKDHSSQSHHEFNQKPPEQNFYLF